jgi:hypothetical protein
MMNRHASPRGGFLFHPAHHSLKLPLSCRVSNRASYGDHAKDNEENGHNFEV